MGCFRFGIFSKCKAGWTRFVFDMLCLRDLPPIREKMSMTGIDEFFLFFYIATKVSIFLVWLPHVWFHFQSRTNVNLEGSKVLSTHFKEKESLPLYWVFASFSVHFIYGSRRLLTGLHGCRRARFSRWLALTAINKYIKILFHR
jgi:hypothetical protein